VRPSWDETFFAVVDAMARRSTCPRLAVGCVIVNDDRQVLVTGYNGAPRGLEHCCDVGCHVVDNHCLRAVHSEANAIAQAARVGVSLRSATLYVSRRPCTRCALLIAQVGIKEVVCRPGPDDDTKRFDQTDVLTRAGIPVRVVKEKA
jgi:dCMP deaminase